MGRCKRECKFCGAPCRCWCHDRSVGRHPLKWVAYRVRTWWTVHVG